MSAETAGGVLVGLLLGGIVLVATFRALRGILGAISSTASVLKARGEVPRTQHPPPHSIDTFPYVRGIVAGAVFAAINLFGFIVTNQILFLVMFLCGMAIIVTVTMMRISRRQ